MNTAVILVARKEKDSDIPYPLIPYENNMCLIDRMLGVLLHYGYEHIIIVVGYHAERFQKYVGPQIVLVEAPNYKYTASMASLAKAKDFIQDDFLLIEGDTFVESKVIEDLSKTAHKNCFTITEESGSGDEAYVEVEQGYITKISKDKHQLSSIKGEMIGISKISYETYQRMLQKWEHSDNEWMNYEYMLMDCTSVLERPCLYFTNLIWGEVDNKDDFYNLCNYIAPKLRRKENPYDYGNLISYLQDIFPYDNLKSKIVIEQIGGLSNKNFKVTIIDKEYVLRVPGLGSEGMVVRAFEEQNSLLGCKLGISPCISYFNDKTGVKLTDYIHNAETLNSATIQRGENLRQIAAIYRKLHYSNIRLSNDFNVFHELRKYENLMHKYGATMYAGYDEIRQQMFGMEARLNQLGVQIRPCHNDAVPENFIKDEKGKIYIIDWEYSGMNDPYWEFAALFLESDFTEESQDFFLDCYFDGNIPVEAKEKISIYEFLQDMLWAIWTVIKETRGDDFGSYGIDRFNRGMKNLQQLN